MGQGEVGLARSGQGWSGVVEGEARVVRGGQGWSGVSRLVGGI